MKLKREQGKALLYARQAGYSGNVVLAQAWIDRANSFWPVSARQVSKVQKFLDLAQRVPPPDPFTVPEPPR